MNINQPFSNSYIYVGNVIHRRFSPKKHSFNYALFMMALDLSDLEQKQQSIGLFGFSWFYPLRFVEKDYLSGEPNSLRHRIINKVHQLNGHREINKIVMLAQVRCFGIYFSPVNFYFCYDKAGTCTQMLAEVSNTPWNERHCYLIDLLKEGEKTNKKVFQVSPFMDLDMSYFWQVTPPSSKDKKLLIAIENRRKNDKGNAGVKLFDARLILHKKALTKKNVFSIWCQLPVMTLNVVISIYWQALKLLLKRVPFLGYQKSNNNSL